MYLKKKIKLLITFFTLIGFLSCESTTNYQNENFTYNKPINLDSNNKNNNSTFFEHLEKNGFQKVQNYVPLYLNYFNLDEKNYNSINLNQKYRINTILKQNSNNTF